ncbi:MAG: hypothetical protein B7Z54_08455, partial [Sphingobacteriales bacterium 12-47-4]
LKKYAPYLLIGLLLLALVLVQWLKKDDNNPSPAPKPRTTTTKDPASNVDRDRGFDRRISFIEYSNHAKCRMACRRISQAEVEEIMRDGTINYKKSDLQNARCPRYALEGRTRDDQQVRIIFAQCNESTTVVTVIDLETGYKCDCPGDDKKYQNKN